MSKDGLQFRASDSISPGLFLDGMRIAWWPAGTRVPDQTTASRVLIAYEDKGSTLTHAEVAALTGEEES